MAYRRKQYRRRRAPVRRLRYRRKRYVRRRRFARANGHSLLLKVRSMRDIILTDAKPDYAEVTGWALDDFSAGSEVTAAAGLFQEYRINMVVVRYIPTNNVSDVNGTFFSGTATGTTLFQTGWVNGNCYTALDFDSTTLPASEAEMLQYGSMRVTPTTRGWTRIIRPRFKTSTLGDGSATPVSVNLRNGWLTTSTEGLTATYRGFKMFFSDCKGYDPGNLADYQVGRILTTVYVSFRKRK